MSTPHALSESSAADRRSIVRFLPALLAGLAGLPGLASAQEASLEKVPAPPPAELDIKTDWTAPVKEALPPADAATVLGTGVTEPDAQKFDGPTRGSSERPLPGELFFDEPGDGSLWVRGSNFKARFDAQGTLYVPFFGSDAPQNFPILFRTPELAGAADPVQSNAPAVGARRAGDAVEFDRPSMVERYEPALHAMEQLFVLPERAPESTAEIVLRVAVETELSVSERDGGLVFSNELGEVTYSQAVAIDADGARLSLATTWTGAAVEIRVPETFAASARYPLTIDPLIATFSLHTGTISTYEPDVAFDATYYGFLMLWEQVWSATDHDVWAEMRSPNGNSLGLGAYIDVSTTNWSMPRVANNNLANNFLVVAEVGPSGSQMIYGRIRDGSSISMGPQFQIDGGEFGYKLRPDVGGDPVLVGPTYFCVVWERVYSTTDRDVHARLVTSAGAPYGGTFLIDNSGGTLDTSPRISNSNGHAPYDTQRWNIVFNREYAPGDQDVRGAQVRWDGFITAPSFSIDSSGYNDWYPVPSSPLDDPGSGFRPWLVTTTRTWPYNNLQGSLLSGPYVVAALSLSAVENVNADRPKEFPSVDSDGHVFQVVYRERWSDSDWDIYAATFRYTGSSLVCTEPHVNLAFDTTDELDPDIFSAYSGGGPRQLAGAVWSDRIWATNDVNIEGAIYSSHLPPVGTSYCTSTLNSSGQASQITATGSPYLDDRDITIRSTGNPTSVPGLFFFGTTAVQAPFGNGYRCAGGTVKRVLPPAYANSSGTAQRTVDWTAPYADFLTGVVYWQYWFRDLSAGGAGFNLSNGLRSQLLP